METSIITSIQIFATRLMYSLPIVFSPASTSATPATDKSIPTRANNNNVAATDIDSQPGPPEERAPENREEISQALDLIRQGQEMFEHEDYLSAIEFWTQAYKILPMCQRSQRDELHPYLGSAYWRAYKISKDELHLRKALEMYSKHREFLGSGYEQVRAMTEGQITMIENEIQRLKVERIQRERKQAAREAVAHERERQRQMKRAELEARIKREHQRFKLFVGLGGSATSLGIVSLGTMVASLALGANIERRGTELAAMRTPRPIDLHSLHNQGTIYNQISWATGVTGGTLLLSGVATMVVTIRRKRSNGQPKPSFSPNTGGLEVRF